MSEESSAQPVSTATARNWDVIRLAAAGLVVVVIGALLPKLLFGPIFGMGDSARLQATLTYAGVMVTAAVALIGTAVKWQSDKRLEVDKVESDRRLAFDKAESDRRLELDKTEQLKQIRLDAAMRAGQLLSPSESGPAHPAAIASGLLALTRLGQAALAVALLVDLWPDTDGPAQQGNVSTETAILVIDAALRCGEPDAQLVAAEMLCRHSGSLKPGQSLHWPSSLEGRWIPSLSHRAKLLIVEAIVRSTLSCRSEDATEMVLRSAAVRLYGIWIGEEDDKRVQGCIGKLICALIDRLCRLDYKEFVQGDRTITMTQLEEAAKSPHKNEDGYLDKLSTKFAEDLKAWASNVSGVYTGPGCLAAAEHSSQGTDQPRRESGSRRQHVAV